MGRASRRGGEAVKCERLARCSRPSRYRLLIAERQPGPPRLTTTLPPRAGDSSLSFAAASAQLPRLRQLGMTRPAARLARCSRPSDYQH